MKYHILLNLCFLSMFFTMCKKKPSAGFGGQSSMILIAKHHGNNIDSISFFVKFNATEAPTSAYDYIVKGTPGGTKIENLKTGDYYLFAEGWDMSISDMVKGGIPFSIDEEGVFNITIPVTEVH